MPHPLKSRALAVALGAAVVVGAANLTAYAANGHPLILGHSNSESSTAGLANSGKGPALSLHSGRKSPSLAVSSSQRVARLNADRVDGKNAADLQTRATTWTIPDGTGLTYDLRGLKPGTYLATMDILLSATTTSLCTLDEAGHPIGVQAYGANRGATFSAVSGVGVVRHRRGGELVLGCSDATAIRTDGAFASQVTLVRLDGLAKGTTQALVH
jgi:hypothetical protein